MIISIIIPVYNSEHSILECLDSVKKQTYDAHYQLIVINDGSTDNSQSIIEDYIKKNTCIDILLINKSNGGVSSARNAGLCAAKGEYIALLDSDDVWLPNKIEKQIAVLQNNPNIDFLGCNVTTWSAKILGKKKDELSRIKLWQQFISWHPATPTVIFKRDIISDVGLYDDTMTHGEDGQFLVRILMSKEGWFMPDRLVEIGGGKPTFGHSGLSSNIGAMHKGQLKILKYAYDQHAINFLQYVFFRMFAQIKHFRRVVITKIR